MTSSNKKQVGLVCAALIASLCLLTSALPIDQSHPGDSIENGQQQASQTELVSQTVTQTSTSDGDHATDGRVEPIEQDRQQSLRDQEDGLRQLRQRLDQLEEQRLARQEMVAREQEQDRQEEQARRERQRDRLVRTRERLHQLQLARERTGITNQQIQEMIQLQNDEALDRIRLLSTDYMPGPCECAACLRGSSEVAEATTRLDMASLDTLDNAPKECCICLDDLAASEPVKLVNCGHIVHGKCLEVWWRTQGSKRMEVSLNEGSTCTRIQHNPAAPTSVHIDVVQVISNQTHSKLTPTIILAPHSNRNTTKPGEMSNVSNSVQVETRSTELSSSLDD
jgi:hypothetical protein